MRYFKPLATAATLILNASTAMADRINVASNTSVDQSVERLARAVEAAGARIFNAIDFARGNASVGETLRPTQVVIFGSPKIGAKTLKRVQTWATYDDPAAVAPTHGLAADDPAVLRMRAALEKFAAIATGK